MRARGSMRLLTMAVSMTVALGGCAVGPDYVRPDAETPQAYKETTGADGWKLAQPRDQLGAGVWWELFDDQELSGLLAQVEISNQNVKVADAQYEHARAAIAQARAAYYPTITATASADRTRQNNSSVRQTQTTTGVVAGAGTPGKILNTYSASLGMTWDADVWGRLRRTTESSVATAQASAADLAAARLSAQVQLAESYFQLRQLDAQRDLLERTLTAYRKALELTTNRYNGGIATRADVAQADTLLKTTQVEAIDVGVQRALLEHAIAILIGKSPAEFSIPAAPLVDAVPRIPEPGVPSDLLERRPDIAAAERNVAAANAQIGVSEAAYFPSLRLSGTGGYASTAFANWISAPNLFWSVGPTIAATLFDFGARRSQYDQAWATYHQTVAQYRETVLTGLQQVEDDLAQLRILEQEAEAQHAAVDAARETVTVVTNRYKAGTATYLDVITAQATQLNNERNALAILGNRMSTSVALIGALGGGWNPQELTNIR